MWSGSRHWPRLKKLWNYQEKFNMQASTLLRLYIICNDMLKLSNSDKNDFQLGISHGVIDQWQSIISIVFAKVKHTM